MTTDALVGKRLVDKLIRVQSLTGEERWVLIHLDVQGNPEDAFAQRLFEYYYRLYDRYKKPIITLAVLTDNNPRWRPERHQIKIWNVEIITFRFFAVKLLDYAEQQDKLEATDNPFGIVVLAHLAAHKTSNPLKTAFGKNLP